MTHNTRTPSVPGLRFALLAVAVAVCAATAIALDPPHDQGNNIQCFSCHAMHKTTGGMFGTAIVPRGTDQEALCRSCHNPTGPASTMTSFSNHIVNGGAKTVDCGSCHDVHRRRDSTDLRTDITAQNLSLIRHNPRKYTSTASSTMVFHARPDHFAFEANPQGAYNAVCQTCHTQTAHHRNDGFDVAHNAGADCVTCHPHEDGFKPSGGCTQCHNTARGARRPIVREFSYTSHHAASAVTDADCTVCHETTKHKQGAIRLFNVDDPTNATEITVISGNPNTVDTEAAQLEGFCLVCHDSDAADGANPFSDDVAPPVVDNTDWDNSSHAGETMSCYGNGSTFGCHASGHGSEKVTLLAPHETEATAPAYAQEEQDVCLRCHNGTGTTHDIEQEVAKGTGHDPAFAGGVHVTGETPDGSRDHVECTDCHNPHQANTTDTTDLPGVMRGVSGLDGSGNALATATKEYQVCYKCHSDSNDVNTNRIPRSINSANIMKRFDTSNASFHPIEGAGKNADVPSLKSGWTTSSLVKCTDCHNNNEGPGNGDTGPAGPHGSDWPFLLERRYVLGTGKTEESAAKYAMCYKCHDRDSILDDESFGEHERHLKKDMLCSACHAPHGVDGSLTNQHGDHSHLINFDTRVVTANRDGKLEFTDDGRFKGTCNLRCHGEDHRDYKYPD